MGNSGDPEPTPGYINNGDDDDPPLSVLIPLVLVAGICFTLFLAILWNRFCRRRRSQATDRYQHQQQRPAERHNCRHYFYPPDECFNPPPYATHFRGMSENPERYRENPAYIDDNFQMRAADNESHRQDTPDRERRVADIAQRSPAVFRPGECTIPPSLQDINPTPGPIAQLLEPSERSSMKKLNNKLVVSIGRKVTSAGDYLPLDNMGIALNIPPGAVKEGEEKHVTLVLNWDLDDNPEMSEDQSLVSPVVYVGPHGLKLEKPCTLSYKHCAYDRRHIQVMRSETELTDRKQWQVMCDQQDDSGTCLLTADEVQLLINTFTLFTCVQSPIPSIRMGKWLQLAAFSYPLKSNIHHHQVRVYFLNKTPCALQWAIQNEANFGGKLMCPEKAFLFYGNAEDIRVNLRYLSDKWEKVDDDDYDRVQYLQIWHGKCPHVSICFRKKESVRPNKELNFSLYVYQDTNDNEGEKIVVHATEGAEELAASVGNRSCNKHSEDHSTVIVNFPIVRSDCHSKVQITRSRNESESSVSVMASPKDCLCALESLLDNPSCAPHSLKVQIRKRLDPECPLGNNWKAFVERIGHGDCIQYIQYLSETGRSPTDLCIALAERKGLHVDDMKKIFQEIGRLDVARIIDNFKRAQEDNHERIPSSHEVPSRHVMSSMEWSSHSRAVEHCSAGPSGFSDQEMYRENDKGEKILNIPTQ